MKFGKAAKLISDQAEEVEEEERNNGYLFCAVFVVGVRGDFQENSKRTSHYVIWNDQVLKLDTMVGIKQTIAEEKDLLGIPHTRW